MNTRLRRDAERIYRNAIRACMPHEAVEKALQTLPTVKGRLLTVAIGKAAWRMTQSALQLLGERIERGIVITKYGHSEGELPRMEICEAGHPIPDESTLAATQRALALTEGLTADDGVLFLVSGGGSALFESVDCSLAQLQALNEALLASGASIEEVNTLRKHLSNVKGGRFAAHCAPAQVFTVVLSDVLGDRLDTIASGPSAPDASTVAQALEILARYGIAVDDEVRTLLARETPKTVENATHSVGGSVRALCRHAQAQAEACGYCATLLTDSLTCQAREAGSFLASIARTHANSDRPLAFVAGGETVVHLRGRGLGGRNQELALAAALGIEGLANVAIFSVGSDGTDGPTDAAGGYADGETAQRIRAAGMDPRRALEENDSYHALAACNDLIFLGATGTNVNDVAVVLIGKALG